MLLLYVFVYFHLFSSLTKRAFSPKFVRLFRVRVKISRKRNPLTLSMMYASPNCVQKKYNIPSIKIQCLHVNAQWAPGRNRALLRFAGANPVLFPGLCSEKYARSWANVGCASILGVHPTNLMNSEVAS